MLFNSQIFVLLFLPIVLLLWWNRYATQSFRLTFLTLASYIFYGWWDYRFVGLLLVSSVVDYIAGAKIYAATGRASRRGWLLVSLTSNLGLLAFFKYCGFFAESWNSVAEWLRTGGNVPVPEIILPVGISFYTFQTLSYSIDLFRGQAKPAKSFLHFAAYVSLFPQLIAGPIVRYSDIEDQLRQIRTRIDWDLFAKGTFFFAAGMAQKILFADLIAARIDPMFVASADLQFFGAWFAMLGYSLQLYFDFAGYSNMAVGLGLMLGFQFPQNFDSPYRSTSIADFWRRWHMTLSYWLRDYVFIPLGGSRQGNLLTLRNLLIVMLLGGLWHGAGWTFVLWGLYHGLLLGTHAITRNLSGWSMPRIPAIGLTFIAVVFGWALFRSTNLSMCGDLWSAMAGLQGVEGIRAALAVVGGVKSLALLIVLLSIVWFAPNLWQISFRPSLGTSFATALIFVICVLRFEVDSPFLYFQF
ncbi:MAG: MBOAT family O-acyltransferase [Planctomycetota bacterium]